MEHTSLIIPIPSDFQSNHLRSIMANYDIALPATLDQDRVGKTSKFNVIYGDRLNILLVGLGTIDGQVKHLLTSAIAKHKAVLGNEIILHPGLLSDCDPLIIEQAACGIVLGLENVGYYQSKNGTRTAYEIRIQTEDEPLLTAFENGLFKGDTIRSIIRLVNAPSNHKTTEHLASWMVESSSKYGYDLTVIEKRELEDHGFHALLAVNRGSEIPAKCLIGTYGKKKTGIPSITIVGKGVTFDTGGLSIKGSNNMHYMKSDMGGAAAAMGAIELAARLNLDVHLRVIIPTTDNSVDAHSIKPGDVISSYSGKSIEVIDTDAEGRLILADGLAYAVKNDRPDYLLDLATLTGSIVRALGNEAAGIMSHNDQLVEELAEAGEEVGERLWRMPIWKSYDQYMKSDIADIKNLSSKPMAGSITAAKFLEFFVDGHTHWAHMDIAGTAFGSYPTSKSYSATGYGIDLLIQWMRLITKNIKS